MVKVESNAWESDSHYCIYTFIPCRVAGAMEPDPGRHGWLHPGQVCNRQAYNYTHIRIYRQLLEGFIVKMILTRL